MLAIVMPIAVLLLIVTLPSIVLLVVVLLTAEFRSALAVAVVVAGAQASPRHSTYQHNCLRARGLR